MTTAYETALIDPPLEDWLSTQTLPADDRLQSLRTGARRGMVGLAGRYVQRLRQIGAKSGLVRNEIPLLAGDPEKTRIVMTGHQPVIFHSGLTFKYETTEQFAAQNQAIAVAVVIDTDEGDAGSFSFPWSETSSSSTGRRTLATTSATFGTGTSLYATGQKKTSAELRQEADRVAHGLRASGCDIAAARFQGVAEQYASLATDSMMEANLIVRWNAGIGGRMLEIPLSAICGIPEVIRFFGEILSRPFEFARCYNETLSAFRAEHRIRNDANPFPSLLLSEERCELPFWIVDAAAGTRTVVSVEQHGSERTIQTTDGALTELLPNNEAASLFSLMIAGKQLIPRGALITAMLRLLLSDLFVHGTGGGRYDRYTDILIRSWWKVEPTPFAVASASRYLFEESRREWLHAQQISEQLRDLQFNPQRHWGTGVFSAALEDILRRKVTMKDDLVERLKKARDTGESARDIGREIQQLGDTIKSIVAAEFEPQLAILRGTDDNTIAAFNNRLWPWMFFETVHGQS